MFKDMGDAGDAGDTAHAEDAGLSEQIQWLYSPFGKTNC